MSHGAVAAVDDVDATYLQAGDEPCRRNTAGARSWPGPYAPALDGAPITDRARFGGRFITLSVSCLSTSYTHRRDV